MLTFEFSRECLVCSDNLGLSQGVIVMMEIWCNSN